MTATSNPRPVPWQRLHQAVAETSTLRVSGTVTAVVGLAVLARGPSVTLGELCRIERRGGRPPLAAEVVGFRDGQVVLMGLGDLEGIGPGCPVHAAHEALSVPVGPELIGRVLDGLGQPLDGLGPLPSHIRCPVQAEPPPPMERPRIRQVLSTGVRAIDALLTCGRGQRLGIFAGSGVGKSTLLGMIARNTAAGVSVIALIGERGRELRDFIERDLGPEGLRRSVVVVATSDQPALVRLKGALVATAIAEYFRDQGQDVVLIMDSVTRLCQAQREIGLAAGEPPATRGYPPSVFSLLPRVLERSGTSRQGSITGFYSVLVDGDDLNEPVADAVRGILDGHVVLSRRLASENHYPAIDVLESVSRLMPDLAGPEQRQAAGQLRSVLATMREAQDLIDIGAYQPGSNPRIDFALERISVVQGFLRQGVDEPSGWEETLAQLQALF